MIVACFLEKFLFSFFAYQKKVTNMPHVERRSYVRGNFSFKIKFKTMTSDEYETLVKSNEANFPPFQNESGIDVSDTKMSANIVTDASLINYLVQMDEKLDQILELLSKDKKIEGLFGQGFGLNISGSGMNILVDEPVRTGEVIHSKFYLSKVPLVYMDIFGEIVRVAEIEESGKTLYSLGIKFLDLSVNDQERIIASVFQKQRGIIRKRKSVF